MKVGRVQAPALVVEVVNDRAESAHVGPFRGKDALVRARMKAEQVTAAARRRDLSVSVTVRPLLPSSVSRLQVLDSMEEEPVYATRWR